MTKFVRGWRRKVGVVTLVMACAFVLGWVRSLLGEDEIRLEIDPQAFYVVVSERQLLTFRYLINRQAPPRPWATFPHVSGRTSPLSSQLLFDLDLKWNFRWLQFGFGESKHLVNDRFQIWIVPYWAIVLPLTALSAFLLLSKSRESKENH